MADRDSWWDMENLNSTSLQSSFIQRPRNKSYNGPGRKVSFVMPRKHSFKDTAIQMAAAQRKQRRMLLSPSPEPDEGIFDGRMRHTYSDAAMNRIVASRKVERRNSDRQSLNAIYDVSQEILRAYGFTPRYKWLLSNDTTLTTSSTTTAIAPRQDPADLAADLEKSRSENDKCEEENLLADTWDCNEIDAITTEDSGQCKANRLDGKRDGNLARRRVGKPQNFYALQKKGKDVYYTKKQLMQQRMKVCDWSVGFALAGIALTVIESELSAFGYIDKGHFISDTLKALIVITTCALLAAIVKYHCLSTKIALVSSGADDWRITLQFSRLLQCLVEISICAICPFPGNIEVEWQVLSVENHRLSRSTQIPLDAVLSVPMFLRSYLLCRFIALHNRNYQDTATRSIAALNYVNVDFPFALKTIMHERPLCALVTFAVTFWISMSWLLTQCERYTGIREKSHYLNSIWLVIITFTSIGYGDLTPQTYCGRALAITTGIMGAGVSSAMIAVISKRMELTGAEKHVNNFIADSKLGRLKKELAAAILQHTWFIHRYRKSSARIDQHKLRIHQRKFLSAIHQFRCVKWDHRRLGEQNCNVSNLPKMQHQMQQSLAHMQRGQDILGAQIAALNREMDKLMMIHKQRKVGSVRDKKTCIYE